MENLKHDSPRGSIVALVTPMTDGGALDREAWRGLLDLHAEAGTDAVVIAGTTGESATLTVEERDWLLEAALERLGEARRVIAGTGGAGTDATIRQSRRAAAIGAGAVLVVTPYYNRPPQRGLAAHFRAVADACEVPVILYNVPSRTSTDLKPETTASLADHG
ncbi:MAG: dihydrodipicolinate synthase family protein, partial [Wenzhouxiangellaceae bacterium]|nr:dihydrodipicolinate synthase family protein [Wenzhouxiangellaceae bacterium]